MRLSLPRSLKHLALLPGVALALATADVRAADLGTGAFRATQTIETQLKRGVSTKADVQKLLGVPNGSGAAVLPSLAFNRERVVKASEAGVSSAPDFGQREIWYYEDVAMTDMKSTSAGYVANLRQQILLVFFMGDVFDGYLWTTNSASGNVSR